jgi:hypothetical protein
MLEILITACSTAHTSFEAAGIEIDATLLS